METTYRDDTYNRAMEFVKNFKQIHPGISNIYVFTSTDKDGNIIDEKYGMNLMTNYGFREVYGNNKTFSGDELNLYVGSGLSEITVEDKSMESVAFNGLAATKSNKDHAYGYPMYYSAGENDGEGLISLISRFLICYYPNNITNFPDPVYISEYGLGTGYGSLYTHSHVYDLTGSLASITKYPDNKLTITVYVCMSFFEHLIQDGWSEKYDHRTAGTFNNKYTIITKNQRMFNRMFDSNLYTYRKTDTQDRTANCSRTIDSATDNVYTLSTLMAAFTMYDGYAADSGYIDGFVQWYTGFHTMEPQFLPEPEEVHLLPFYSDAPYSYKGFSDRFGKIVSSSSWAKAKYPPITTLFDVEVNLFNYRTGEWDNKVDVYNPDDKWYNEMSMLTSFAQPIYYSNKGEILTAYVYQNLRPDDPITHISSNIITVYATDKYWDYSSWIWINDYNNLPEKARTAKYWITNTNSASLTVYRESDCFQLLEKGTNRNGFETYQEFNQVNGCYSCCGNYDYGWYMNNNKVYVPNTRLTFNIGASGTTATESMTYGRWLITFNSVSNKYFITDMTDVINGTIPTSVEYTIPYTTGDETAINVNSLTGCYRTKTDTGIICMQAISYNKAHVIDLRGEAPRQLVFNWKRSAAIWGTNKIAYIPTDANEIRIYDMDTNSDNGVPIQIPEGSANVVLMFGHTNYLWFSDCSSYAYGVDLRDRIPQGCENSIQFSDLQYVKMTCVDDVLIIYRYNQLNIGNAYYIRIPYNILQPKSLSELEPGTSSLTSRIDFNICYLQENTLALLITRGYTSNSGHPGSQNRVVDFGRFLLTDEVSTWTYTDNDLPQVILYGENLIWKTRQKGPMINWLGIKLDGKTNTISALNKIKRVSNKQWFVSFTNTPMWGYEITGKGTPPGVPLAKTDKDGTITGWMESR